MATFCENANQSQISKIEKILAFLLGPPTLFFGAISLAGWMTATLLLTGLTLRFKTISG